MRFTNLGTAPDYLPRDEKRASGGGDAEVGRLGALRNGDQRWQGWKPFAVSMGIAGP